MVNYSNFNDADVSSSEQSTSNIDEAPKFIDMINPLLTFSNDDLKAMKEDVDIESDSSDDDSVDLGKSKLQCNSHFPTSTNFVCSP